MLRLAKDHDMLTVVNDQFGSPTSALELARMILYIIYKKDYGIYHATCEGITSWYDFAKEIFKQASVSIQVKPVSTEEYPAAIAKRPAYSVLENAHLHALGDYRMKDWKDALKEYMSDNEPIKASE
jgi:dTDP-4-dehydrorhamnose reductase